MTATTTRAATWPRAPESPGTTNCPQCGARLDYLVFTPSGLCPICAGRADPIPNVTLYSDPFWLLTPQEIERAETEIIRLAAEAKRLDESSEALAREFGDGSDEYEVEAERYYAVERERLLLHMLHAASRQFKAVLGPELAP